MTGQRTENIDMDASKEKHDQESALQMEPQKPQPSEDKQIGVHKIEAVTDVWSKWMLIAAYAKYV